ncbi:MAG: leucine--tRNA ligase [Candidatus Jorgensenbacteria bacterium]
MKKYDFAKIEKKWQGFWDDEQIYVARDDSKKEKRYVLTEFPYPSGEGLHMGHLRPYTAGDVYSRYLRMNGYEVLFPIGWDAFGLPAENYAIKQGIHPRITTEKNVENAKRQLKSWGMGFDWSREVNTTDPDYYKWTQWLFLQFWKHGLAYEAKGEINWCPSCKTGLANEEATGGSCERCGTKVEKKELRQWYLKITAYAEKLLEGLKNLDWPAPIKVQQENWIGRSEGALIKFPIVYQHQSASGNQHESAFIEVFTTRPDTLFGATYMVVAPEHELLVRLKPDIENWSEVEKYIAKARAKTDEERTAETKSKTGVELKGIKAINPVNQEEIPVFVADYVLGGYGTGAIMAVPAHDERDFAFAETFHLSMPVVIWPEGSALPRRLLAAYTGEGKLVNSGKFDGMDCEKAKEAITKFAGGAMTVQYKLRDWVFSRQRYWGEPIPLVHCEKCGVVPVPENELPVKLPDVKKYEPTGTGESPLATIDSWVNVKCPKCGGPAKRETNTMPQWAGSSWYYLRYADPKNKKTFADKKLMEHWLPVDVYFGGMEHTTLHLLYSRFWHRFLFDQKLVPTPEPYAKRVPHGIILGPDGEKMSKSRGNVVNPDEIVKTFGADCLRMYELFLGPHDAMVSWQSDGILGISRFLERVWKFYTRITTNRDTNDTDENSSLNHLLHKTIKKVTGDIENFKFNTAVSALMILLNEMEHANSAPPPHGSSNANAPMRIEYLNIFLKLLAPFAPHLAEELWSELGHKTSIHLEKWPTYDPRLIKESEVTIAVQVNGKLRGTVRAPAGAAQNAVERLVQSDAKLQAALQGKTIKKTVFVPDRLVNFVV